MPQDKDKWQGRGEKLAGKVKKAVGRATGDRSTQASGKAGEIKGAVREKVGQAKGAAKRSNSRRR